MADNQASITRVINLKAGDTSAIDRMEELRDQWKRVPVDAKPALDFVRDFDRAQGTLPAKAKKAADAAKDAYATQTKQAIDKAIKAMRDYDKAVADAEKQTASLGRTADSSFTSAAKGATFNRDNIGDTSTALGSFASVTNAFGSSAIGEGLAFGGDVFGAIEYLPNFADAVKNAGQAARDSSGLVGTLATGLQAAIPALGGVGAGLGAIALAAAPFVAIGVGIVALVSAINAAQAALEAEVNRTIARGQTEVDARRQIEDDLRRLDTDSIRRKQEELAFNVQYNEKTLAALRERQAAAQKELDDRRYVGAGGFNSAERNAAEVEFFALQKQIEELQAETNLAQGELKQYNEALFSNEFALADAQAQAKKTTQGESDLTKQREQHEAVLAQLAQQEAALVTAYNERVRLQQEDRALQDARASEDSAISERRAAEDLARQQLRQEQAHQAKLLQIEADGANRIASLRQSLVDKTAETFAKIADINREYEENRARETAAFVREQVRREEDFNRERRRAAEDYRQSQFEAILENDVSAYLSNQRSFATDESRAREDFDVERTRANEDFALAQELAQQRRDVAIQELQVELEAFRQQTAAKIAEETAAIQTRLEAERVAYEEQLALDADARAIQRQRDDEDAALRARRQTEDRAIQDQRARDQLQSQLNDITTKRNAELAALNSVLGVTQQIAAQARAVSSGGTSGYNYTRSGGYSGYRDSGGAGVAGGAYMIGTKAQPELFIPNTAGQFIPNIASAMGGDVTVNVDVGAVGEIVTPSQLSNVVNAIVAGVEGAIHKARKPTQS